MFLSGLLAKLTVLRLIKILAAFYRGAEKSLARPGRKQANVSVSSPGVANSPPANQNLGRVLQGC